MTTVVRRRRTQFQRAADGSMTLLDHLRELRTRLIKAVLGIGAGFIAGWFMAGWAKARIEDPYCSLMRRQAAQQTPDHVVPAGWQCPVQVLHATDGLVLTMQIALWLGLIIAAPIWLYQLWAFIAPGLHRHERRWAYVFAVIAAPLFALGAIFAYLVVGHGLQFLVRFNTGAQTNLALPDYVSFVTGLMLLFGIAFEFPLVVMLFNIAGIATAQRLMHWWRWAVLLFFLFAGVALPTGDPFSMIALGTGLSALYFAAVGFAYFNDRRRMRANPYATLPDNEASPQVEASLLDEALEPVLPSDHVEPVSPMPAPAPIDSPRSLDRRFDDLT